MKAMPCAYDNRQYARHIATLKEEEEEELRYPELAGVNRVYVFRTS
jgi:hypothetical protein